MRSLRDEPATKGIDVRQQLKDFHDRHYRAPAMQLVVLGGQSLDELQEMVVESFSGVAAAEMVVAATGEGGRGGKLDTEKKGGFGMVASAAVAAAGLPFDSSALGKAYRIQPVKDIHRLNVTWQLGEQLRYLFFLSFLLTDENRSFPKF